MKVNKFWLGNNLKQASNTRSLKQFSKEKEKFAQNNKTRVQIRKIV